MGIQIFRGLTKPVLTAILAAFVAFSPQAGYPHSLSPEGSRLERTTSQQKAPWYDAWLTRILGGNLRHFSEPVHEELTHRIFDCDGDGTYCGQVDIEFAPWQVLYGLRWNDDPPFSLTQNQGKKTTCRVSESIRLVTQPRCWKELFRDAEEGAKAGKNFDGSSGVALLYRVHFGDLQFLHGMATTDGEKAGVTRKNILMWAEFTWRIMTGEYQIGTYLKEVKVAGLNDKIARPDWRIQDLFTYGFDRVRPHIKHVAFGSLLHMVQDSFAGGHVERAEPTFGEKCGKGAEQNLAPGRVVEFHAYNRQNHDEHARHDERRFAMSHLANTRPHVVTVGRALRRYYEDGASWEVVKPYIECVFSIQDAETPASPGNGFQ